MLVKQNPESFLGRLSGFVPLGGLLKSSLVEIAFQQVESGSK